MGEERRKEKVVGFGPSPVQWCVRTA